MNPVAPAEGSSGDAILIVAAFPDSVLTFRGALIAALMKSGQSVHVACPFGNETRIRADLDAMGVRTHDVPLKRAGTNPLADLNLLRSLVDLMKRIRPARVLGYTVKPVVYGMLGGWLAGVPRRYALVTGLGYAFTGERRGLVSYLVARLYRLAMTKTDKVFFQNPDDRDLFLRTGILPPGKPSVIVEGSGIDLVEFPSSDVPAGPVSFLMIGRLLGDKGVREFAAAAARIRQLRPATAFHLVGWIDENPDAISTGELDGWIATGAIEYHGKLADVRPILTKSAVYVLPSYREGTPRTVLEAMATGRPIITTDAPGCRETVVDGENGFLVPPRSVDALVAAMLKFIDDPSLAPRMGRRSRQIAEVRYDVHKVNAIMLREMDIRDVTRAGAGPT